MKNNLLSKHLQPAITSALKEEIELWRSSPFTHKLDEKTFDPTDERYCFFGQTGNQHTYLRETIGRVPRGYGLGRYNNHVSLGYEGITPLEIWSAYNWAIDKELVLKVLRYIKKESDVLPEVEYSENAAY